jgi:hypothetical protein
LEAHRDAVGVVNMAARCGGYAVRPMAGLCFYDGMDAGGTATTECPPKRRGSRWKHESPRLQSRRESNQAACLSEAVKLRNSTSVLIVQSSAWLLNPARPQQQQVPWLFSESTAGRRSTSRRRLRCTPSSSGHLVSVGPCSINQIEKVNMVGKSMCLLAIDTFSEIDIIEDDLFLGFIYLVDYPILPNSVFPETLQLTTSGKRHVNMLACHLQEAD